MRGGHANDAEREEMQQQQAEALANSATSTAADRQAVAELSISNATLTHELRAATETIEMLQQRLASCACATTDRGKRTAAATGKPTTPTQSEPRLYATGSRWILLVAWLSRQ